MAEAVSRGEQYCQGSGDSRIILPSKYIYSGFFSLSLLHILTGMFDVV